MNCNPKIRRVSIMLMLCCMIFLMLPVQAHAASKIKLNKTKLTIYLGQTQTLKIVGTDKKIRWSSTNKKIASVSSKGVVKGVNPGSVNVNAKIGKKTLKCKVTVKNNSVKASALKFKINDGTAFVRGTSSAKISFKLKKPSANVTVSVKNSSNSVVYKKTYSMCKENVVYAFNWNGKNKNGKSVTAGSYYVEIKAGNTKTKSNYITVIEQVFAGGTGSKNNPFCVKDLSQLKLVGQYNGCYFKQVANISGNYQAFDVLYSDESNPFSGNYNGNGYTISKLMIKDETVENVALFGTIGKSGSLINIRLEDIGVIGSRNGACVLASNNYGKIINCSVINSNVSATSEVMGFLVLFNQEGATISGCSVSGCSAAGSDNNGAYAGGLAVDNHGIIIDCQVSSSKLQYTWVSGKTVDWACYAHVTGLVRWNTGQMRNCKATDVAAVCQGRYAGGDNCSGICQLNEGMIINCSFSGTATYEGVNKQNGIFQ